MGLILENEELASRLADWFDDEVGKHAYRLELRRRAWAPDRIEWVTVDGEQEIRLTKEPGTGFWQRLKLGLMSWLPFEDQL